MFYFYLIESIAKEEQTEFLNKDDYLDYHPIYFVLKNQWSNFYLHSFCFDER